jgi:hypothetical protein
MLVVVQEYRPRSPLGMTPLQRRSDDRGFLQGLYQMHGREWVDMLFWSGPWPDGECISSMALDLVDTFSRRHRNQRTVATTLQNNDWIRDIEGALTIPTLIQYIHLREWLEGVVLDPANTQDHAV